MVAPLNFTCYFQIIPTYDILSEVFTINQILPVFTGASVKTNICITTFL